MEEQQKPQSQTLLDLESFKAVTVLGRGAKGIVFLVKDDKETLALKVISRGLIERKRSIGGGKEEEESDYYKRSWLERDMLSLFDHPLLPKLRGFVSTDQVIGFAIDYCSGGDLNTLRRKQTEKMFSDDVIKFYAAELVLALEHLHGLGVTYRDLKPDNIMIQDNGHLMIVDFDLSTRLSLNKSSEIQVDHVSIRNSGISDQDESTRVCFGTQSVQKSNSFVGTEDYIAPEILQGKGHDFAVDWWSLGVVLYEMLYGRTPFRGRNVKETFQRILTRSPELVGEKTDLRDLIRLLLEKDPSKRIALDDIKAHDFFRGLDWNTVLQISRPPYIPVMKWDDENFFEDIKGIDVHLVVKDIFDGDNQMKRTTKCDKVEKNNRDSKNFHHSKSEWVASLQNTDRVDDFSIF